MKTKYISKNKEAHNRSMPSLDKSVIRCNIPSNLKSYQRNIKFRNHTLNNTTSMLDITFRNNSIVDENKNKCKIRVERNTSTKMISNRNKQSNKEKFDSMMTRFENFQKKCEKNHKEAQKKKVEEEMREVTKHPSISIKTKSNIQGDFMSRNEIFVKKIDRQIEKKKNEQLLRDSAYLNPKFKQKRKLSEITKRVDSFFTWEENKQKRIQKTKEEMEKKQLIGCTFKPKLNNITKKMKKCSSTSRNIPIKYAPYSIQITNFSICNKDAGQNPHNFLSTTTDLKPQQTSQVFISSKK